LPPAVSASPALSTPPKVDASNPAPLASDKTAARKQAGSDLFINLSGTTGKTKTSGGASAVKLVT
jgi:hypothetical protein